MIMFMLYIMIMPFHQGLERDALSIIKSLCEEGVNPQALAQVIKFLRREAAVAPAK